MANPLISEITAGSRNHKNCEENSVSDGTSFLHPVERASRESPKTDSTTNAMPRATCSHRLTTVGIPSDRNRGSVDGPVWKPRNKIKYDATKAPYKARRPALSGSAPARRANIMNSP